MKVVGHCGLEGLHQVDLADEDPHECPNGLFLSVSWISSGQCSAVCRYAACSGIHLPLFGMHQTTHILNNQYHCITECTIHTLHTYMQHRRCEWTDFQFCIRRRPTYVCGWNVVPLLFFWTCTTTTRLLVITSDGIFKCVGFAYMYPSLLFPQSSLIQHWCMFNLKYVLSYRI